MTTCTERGCRSLEWKCRDCGRITCTAEFNEWFDPNICLPLDDSIVEVLGNPTYCCEEDMEEEGIYKCRFIRKLSEWKPDMSWYKFSETFYVCDDEDRHMQVVKGWRPHA